MAERNHGPPLPMKATPHGGMPLVHEPPFGRNLGPMPHPTLLEEMKEAEFARSHRPLPPHPAIIEKRLSVQHQDIQGLLVDNQRLAATHVALKQELEAAQQELQQTDHFARNFLVEKDMQMRELYEKSAKMEHDIHGVEGMQTELMKLHADVKELTVTRQKLTAQVQAMSQDFARANTDLQQLPALKSEIGGLRQELQQAGAAIEHEKKGHAENYEHGQVMEKNLLSMARELEKLRAEMANAEKKGPCCCSSREPNSWCSLVLKAILCMNLELDLGAHMTCNKLKDTDKPSHVKPWLSDLLQCLSEQKYGSLIEV
ncbi:hypothetical protein R6Q57_008450 [Mikania cordata]